MLLALLSVNEHLSSEALRVIWKGQEDDSLKHDSSPGLCNWSPSVEYLYTCVWLAKTYWVILEVHMVVDKKKQSLQARIWTLWIGRASPSGELQILSHNYGLLYMTAILKLGHFSIWQCLKTFFVVTNLDVDLLTSSRQGPGVLLNILHAQSSISPPLGTYPVVPNWGTGYKYYTVM